MSLVQKYLLGLLALGAGFLVITNADKFYTVSKGLSKLTSGAIVDVTTGKNTSG